MNEPQLLSDDEIRRLLIQQCISHEHPWAANDEQLIEGHLKAVCAAVERRTRSMSRIEWNHYGSGYASFVDAWFYRNTPDFNPKRPLRFGEEHTGLIVLLSRLSPYFVFMEGEKSWHAHGGSHYLPEYDMLDRLQSGAVKLLASQVQPILEEHGLVRASREQLSEPLSPNINVPTILSDRGLCQFDALFYWED